MADTPAASKDAPTDEAVMVNIAGNAQDLERAKEHARLLLKRVAAGPVGDGLSHAEYALLCLYAHVATLTAQLEAERATGDETARHISRLLDHLARETARADKAVAEAKALREAAEQAYGYLWVTSAMVPKDDPVSLARKRLLDEIGGWNSAGQRRGIAFATDQFEVGPDGVRPKRATLAQPAADGGDNG